MSDWTRTPPPSSGPYWLLWPDARGKDPVIADCDVGIAGDFEFSFPALAGDPPSLQRFAVNEEQVGHDREIMWCAIEPPPAVP